MRGRPHRRGRIERQILASELAAQERRVFGEKEDASVEADARGHFVHRPGAETLYHASEDAGGGGVSQAT
jgi:hypothetical protein